MNKVLNFLEFPSFSAFRAINTACCVFSSISPSLTLSLADVPDSVLKFSSFMMSSHTGNLQEFLRGALKTTGEVSEQLFTLSRDNDPVLARLVYQKLSKLKESILIHLDTAVAFTVLNPTGVPSYGSYSFCLGRLFNLALDLKTAQV